MIKGNAAKAYCIQRINALSGPLTILDMGCGDGRNFIELLNLRPDIRYVGVDPHGPSVARGRQLSTRLELHHGNAESFTLAGGADVIVSFSVFEHVIARRAYMQAVARNLKPGGVAMINYDAGHFTTESTCAPARTMIKAAKQAASQTARNMLARMGLPFSYERFVSERDFAADCAAAGLTITESKSFNTPLKQAFRAVPSEAREEFCARWLDLELWLNEYCEYSDSLAPTFTSRCHMLTHRA